MTRPELVIASTTNAELVNSLTSAMTGLSLRRLWEGLGETDKLAVADVRYGPQHCNGVAAALTIRNYRGRDRATPLRCNRTRRLSVTSCDVVSPNSNLA